MLDWNFHCQFTLISPVEFISLNSCLSFTYVDQFKLFILRFCLYLSKIHLLLWLLPCTQLSAVCVTGSWISSFQPSYTVLLVPRVGLNLCDAPLIDGMVQTSALASSLSHKLWLWFCLFSSFLWPSDHEYLGATSACCDHWTIKCLVLPECATWPAVCCLPLSPGVLQPQPSVTLSGQGSWVVCKHSHGPPVPSCLTRTPDYWISQRWSLSHS